MKSIRLLNGDFKDFEHEKFGFGRVNCKQIVKKRSRLSYTGLCFKSTCSGTVIAYLPHVCISNSTTE